ncbi:MAG: SEC-C metal-binding domain-containing protein [Firmicutes bacterium]|nr:SEC-C metal-binding domain-containing protein [Bacillota bacterium]
MTLYERWLSRAYDKKGASVKPFWDKYLPQEKRIYQNLIGNKEKRITGSLAELAERYQMPPENVCGFLDGIHEALDGELDAKELTAESQIDVTFGFEALYKKMVEYKAGHLYTLPEWESVFDAETRERLAKEQRASGTYVREAEKIGRNDLCPCGSGKKYKKCCGAPVASDSGPEDGGPR